MLMALNYNKVGSGEKNEETKETQKGGEDDRKNQILD